MMRVLYIFSWLALALALAGCGSGNDDFTTQNSMQRTLEAGEALTMTLPSGASLAFPATATTAQTLVIFSDIFTSTDADPARYPTPTKASGDVLGAAVVNTPADVAFADNFTLTFALPPAPEGEVPIPAGTSYIVYRFDFNNLSWNAWGSTAAVVNAESTQATAALPTNGIRGFIGSLAIFKGQTSDLLPAGGTTIAGTVVDANGDPLATDVGIYVMVGSQKYPAEIANGRVPSGGTVANTVDSDVTGHFSMTIPDNLIGQPVNLQFGREDTEHKAQTYFEILAPATPVTQANLMIVRFGENNVKSRPVGTGTDSPL